MAKELDEAELDELREYFNGYDTNKDGSIQHSEFADLLTKLGSDVSKEEIDIGFAELDTDNDGNIDFEEFLKFWSDH